MELSEYIQNGITRLDSDAVNKKELIKAFKEWSKEAKKLEKERDKYQTGLLAVKKHFSIMFQRDAAIMNKSTVYTIVTKTLNEEI